MCDSAVPNQKTKKPNTAPPPGLVPTNLPSVPRIGALSLHVSPPSPLRCTELYCELCSKKPSGV